jgi:predicted transcriptional regulator
MAPVLLMSIRPEFAAKILSGRKTFELRRVRPRISAGETILVYASYPVQAILGEFVVSNVIEASPSRLWAITRHRSGLTRRQFREYFQGAHTAYGIEVREVTRLERPVALDKIRHTWPGFRPPQSYMYLSEEDAFRLS